MGSELFYDPVWTHTFTGTNGDDWNSTAWPTTTVDPNNSSGTIDIQGNEGSMTTPAVTSAYVSGVAQSTTEVGAAQLLFKFTGARQNTGNQWLYACIGSSGEVQDSADGRPASTYYLRIDTGSGETGSNDKVYRRKANNEVEMTDGGEGGNIQIVKKNISRPSTGDFWCKLRVETDEDGTVIFKGSQWGVAGTEPNSWQFVIVDSNPATISGGGLQFVTRNYNSSTGSSNAVDDVEYWDTSDNDHWEQYFDGPDGNSIITSNHGPDYLDATVATGGTMDYDDDQPNAIVIGDRCGKISHGTSSGDVGVRMYKGDGSAGASFLETANVYASCYFYRDAALGADHDIFTIDNPSNGAEVTARYVNSDSTLRLVVDGSVSGTFTTTFPADELIRIDLHANDVGSTNGTAEMRVFTGNDVHKDSTQVNATEYKTATGATLNGGSGLRGASVGMFGTGSTTTAALWVDALVVSTRGWPSPRAVGVSEVELGASEGNSSADTGAILGRATDIASIGGTGLSGIAAAEQFSTLDDTQIQLAGRSSGGASSGSSSGFSNTRRLLATGDMSCFGYALMTKAGVLQATGKYWNGSSWQAVDIKTYNATWGVAAIPSVTE